MAAKVNSASVQDGYQLYHHAEPHEAICSEQTAPTLNLVAAEQEHVDGPRTRSWIGRTRWMR